MTIQGARDELINMMECKDIPFYFVPILKKVVETIEMEFATVCDIDVIRAEVAEAFIKHGLGNTEICFDVLKIIDRKGEQHDR